MLDTGIPLGPPDLDGFASSWMSTEGLSISAFSVLAQGTVTATTYDGRPALVVARRGDAGARGSGRGR